MQEYGICTYNNQIHAVVIDPVTLEPWGTSFMGQNPGNSFGNVNNNGGCRSRSENYFIYFQTDGVQMAALENLLNNEVPDGHYILLYAPMGGLYSWWQPSFFSTLAALGSDSLYAGRPNYSPFAFFCRKGDPNSAVEVMAQSSTEDIILNAILEGSDYLGFEDAPRIGPAARWDNVYWKQDPEENPTRDTTMLTIRAYDWNGSLQMTIDTLFTLNDSIVNLNNIVDAASYPYIDLAVTYLDSVDFTPAQVDRMHVLFAPLPEAAIDGTTAYTWSANGYTFPEGEQVEFAVDVKNIFSVDMDSLLVSYWLEDENDVRIPIAYPRQDPLLVGETLRDTIVFSTEGLSGVNSFWMEVNPYVNGSNSITDQPEQQHFNNILEIPFYVTPDTINPILDVTFNGNHILNGDIIDPNSEILITLKDENPFIIMDDIADTLHFGVYLTDPAGNQTRIPFVDASGNVVMQWVPATAQNKRFKILWPAEFTQDGKYTLLVQGSDRTGNLSGDYDYRVSFEIIHESSITQMMNYPNPFSTSTRFVFTVTGTEPPDDLIIQILTVSGRVVREITEDQLGLIQIGRNISEYAWDGTDEFGDPLANGVYLYRVKARLNGEDIKRRESGADQYFEKDFGKMYLFR
jgi:flagellar hook assembly protein FlgD